MNPVLPACRSRWRSGCAGVAVFLVLWGTLFFIAFMIALGNETPTNRLILQTIGHILTIANPLWGIPASGLAGMFLFQKCN